MASLPAQVAPRVEEWRGAGGVAMDCGAGEVTKRTAVLGDGWRVVLGAPREAARERCGGGDTPVILAVVSDQPVGVHLHRLPVELVRNSKVLLPGVQVGLTLDEQGAHFLRVVRQ